MWVAHDKMSVCHDLEWEWVVSTGPSLKRLATLQQCNTSLKIHNGLSKLATNDSMINSAENWADGRWFFKGSRKRWICGCWTGSMLLSVWTVSGEKAIRTCWLTWGVHLPPLPAPYLPQAYFFLPPLRYLDTFRPCIPPLSPYSEAALLGYCSVTQ